MTGFNVLTNRRFLTIQSVLVATGLTLSSLLMAAPGNTQTDHQYLDLRRRGSAPNKEGDASRGCELSETQLGEPSMLIPYLLADNSENEAEITGYYAMITDSQASLWMYMPYTPEKFESMEISLWDKEMEHYVYKSTVTDVGTTPGIVGVTLPSDSIQAGKRYEWLVTIKYHCDAGDGAASTGTDRKAGVLELGNWSETWYSTMVQAARRHCAGEPVSDWDTLLSNIDAEELATVPVSACLSPANTWILEG